MKTQQSYKRDVCCDNNHLVLKGEELSANGEDMT